MGLRKSDVWLKTLLGAGRNETDWFFKQAVLAFSLKGWDNIAQGNALGKTIKQPYAP